LAKFSCGLFMVKARPCENGGGLFYTIAIV
jgi:hypothetical protein